MLGSRDTDAELAFGLSQLITQAHSFGAIFVSFDTELDGADAAHRIHYASNEMKLMSGTKWVVLHNQ
jgi:hypothetical protein